MVKKILRHRHADLIRKSLLTAALAALVIGLMLQIPHIRNSLHPVRFIGSDQPQITVEAASMDDGEISEQTVVLARGTQVELKESSENTSKVLYNDQVLIVPNDNLKNTLAECLDYDTVFPRRNLNLRKERGSEILEDMVVRGEPLKVLAIDPADLDRQTGEITWIQVEKDGRPYYINGAAVEFSYEDAMKSWSEGVSMAPTYDSVYGEGYSQHAFIDSADFKGGVQPDFADNPRRNDLYGIHISAANLMKNKDELLKVKNETALNTLTVIIKGPDGQCAYRSDVLDTYYKNPENALLMEVCTKEEMKELVSWGRLNGFYMIGRIEAFADPAAAMDSPEYAITDRQGNPALYSESYWLSPYVRRNWKYNADLAKEAAELGFNEIQFDFCRFPDGTSQAEAKGDIDMKNNAGESKTEALQNFIYYVREELEPMHVYTAVDTYGGPIVDRNDYGIGQFYPAIAAAANIVCPMVYYDTLPSWLYGEPDSEKTIRDTMAVYARAAQESISHLAAPASIRFWIQGYNNTSAERLAEEIRGLIQGGQSGYMVWTDQGYIEDIEYLKDGFIPTAGSGSLITDPALEKELNP